MSPNAKVYLAKDGRTYVDSTIESADCWIDAEGNLGDYCAPNGFFPVRETDLGERVIVGLSEAIRRMPVGPAVKVATEARPGVVLLADWPRESVVALLRACGVEESGPKATAHGFGLASWDGRKWLFVETR